MFNFNIQKNRTRFGHDLATLGLTDESLKLKEVTNTLPLPLAEYNVMIGQYGKPAYRTEQGALKGWQAMCKEYLDGLAIEKNAAAQRATREETALVEAETDKANLPSTKAAKDLEACEKTIAKKAADMLHKFRKDNVDYAWHDLVSDVRDYIALGRLAGRNSVETLAEIRTHVYDLAGYKARNKDAKPDAGDMDADITAQMAVNTAFENNVTRAVKCGLLAERGAINIRLGEVDGVVRLIAPFNQIQPIVTAGGKQKANPFDHDVVVTITNLEALYSETFKGQKRQAKAGGKVQGIKDAAKSLASNAGGYSQFNAEVKGDIDTALQSLMVQPEAVAASMTGNAVEVIKAIQEALENMEHTDATIVALVSLADAIEMIVEGFEGEAKTEANA